MLTDPHPAELGFGHAVTRWWDAALVGSLLMTGLWVVLNTSQIDRIPGFDLNSYIALAEQPERFFSPTVDGYHSQRILPSLIVWGLNRLPYVSIDLGFRLLSAGSYLAFALLTYLALRASRVSPFVAFGTTAFSIIATWPITYSLGNIYQANDAMVYPLGVAMMLAVAGRRPIILFMLSLVAVVTRQNLVLLATFANVALFAGTRRWSPLATIALVWALFALSTSYAGGGTTNSLLRHVNFSIREAVHGMWAMQIWLFFGPFLLVLIDRRSFQYAVKYWWVTLFSLITIAQPLGIYTATGPANVIRIGAQGIFPTFLLAGLLIEARMRSPISRAVYAVLPFLYGTAHLVYMKKPLKPIGLDPQWFIVVVFGLVLIDSVWRCSPRLRRAVLAGGGYTVGGLPVRTAEGRTPGLGSNPLQA